MKKLFFILLMLPLFMEAQWRVTIETPDSITSAYFPLLIDAESYAVEKVSEMAGMEAYGDITDIPSTRIGHIIRQFDGRINYFIEFERDSAIFFKP